MTNKTPAQIIREWIDFLSENDTNSDALTVQLLDVISHVSRPNGERAQYMSTLYHLLKNNKFDFKLANQNYRIGRIVRVNNKDAIKAGEKFRTSFYSNIVVPHFIIKGDGINQIETLIQSGVGGIVAGYDDPSGTQVLSNYYAIAYEVPQSLIDIEVSIADTIENSGLADKYQRVLNKARHEAEILAITKEAHNTVIDENHILAYCSKRHGYNRVTKNLEDW